MIITIGLDDEIYTEFKEICSTINSCQEMDDINIIYLRWHAILLALNVILGYSIYFNDNYVRLHMKFEIEHMDFDIPNKSKINSAYIEGVPINNNNIDNWNMLIEESF